MTVDPRFGFWFSIGMVVLGVIAGGASQFTDLGLSPGEVKALLAGDTLLLTIGNGINALLHAIPSKPGAANEFYLGPKPGAQS